MQNAANPDTRPLFPGWSQHRDSNGSWYYVNTSVKPPQITYNHPAGDLQSLPPQSLPQNVAMKPGAQTAQIPLSRHLYASSTGNPTTTISTPLLPPPSLRASLPPGYPSASLSSNGLNMSQPMSTAPAPGQYLPTMQLSPTSTLPSNTLYQPNSLATGTQPYQQAQLQQQHSMSYPGVMSAQKQLPSPPGSVIYNQVPTVGTIPPSLQPNRSIWGTPRNGVLQPQHASTLSGAYGHTPLPPQKQYEPLTTELAARKAKEGYKVLKKFTKTALKGAVAVTTGIPPQAFANATTALVNSDIANALASSFTNQDSGVAQEDLQAVLQGNPDANYDAVIAALMAQQQQQQEQMQQQLQLLQQQGVAAPAPTPPSVDYQALIAELQRIQNLANQRAALAQTANMQLMAQAQAQQNAVNASSLPQSQPGFTAMQLQQSMAGTPLGAYNMQNLQPGVTGSPLQKNQRGIQLQQQMTGTLAGANLAQQQQLQAQQAYQQGLQGGQPVLLPQHRQSVHSSMMPGYRPQGPTSNSVPQPSQFSPIPAQLQPNRPPSMQFAPHPMPQSQTHAASSSSSPSVYAHSHSPSIASRPSRPQSQAQMQPLNQMPTSSSPSYAQSTSTSNLPPSRPQSQAQSQPLNSMPNPHVPTPPPSPPKVNEPYPTWTQAQGTTVTQASTVMKPPAYTQTPPVPPEQAYPTPPGPTSPPQKPSQPAQGTSPPPLTLHQPQPVQPFEPPQVPPTPPQQQPQVPAKPEKPSQGPQVQQPLPQPAQQPTQQPAQQPVQQTQPAGQPGPPDAQPQQVSQPPPLQSPYEAWQQQEAQAQVQAEAEAKARQDAAAVYGQAQSEARMQAHRDAIAAYQQQVAQQQQAVQDALTAAQQQAQQQQQQQELQDIYQQAFQQQQDALNAAGGDGQEEQGSSLQNLIQAAYGQQAPADPTQNVQYQSLLQTAYAQQQQTTDVQAMLQAAALQQQQQSTDMQAMLQASALQQQQQQSTDMQAMLQASALQQQQAQFNMLLQQQQQLQLLQAQQAQQQQAQQPSVLETLLGATLNQQQPQDQQPADAGGGFNLMGALTSGFESMSTSDESQQNSENW